MVLQDGHPTHITWAVAEAGKDVENRTWTTSWRGLLGIHATLFWGVVFGLLSMIPAVGAGLRDVVEAHVGPRGDRDDGEDRGIGEGGEGHRRHRDRS